MGQAMITSLHINNFAIIEKLSLDFFSGFSVFSGETGAGKSILITALNLLLGSRALTEYIRSGQDSATVEGVFNIPENSLILPLLEEKGIEISEEGQVFIKRKIFGSEKNNRCYLNHQPCSLSVLSEVGKWLVDIHGQHEHQFLLNPERHLDVLDAFGNLNELREKFSEIYGQYEHILRDLQSLQSRQQTQERDRDLIVF